MKLITSKDNSIIKEAASLNEKKYRDSLGLYLAEGPNLVKELMDFGGRPRFIFIRAGASDEAMEIASAAKEPTAVYELTADVFNKIASSENPQGIIAVAEKRTYDEKQFFEAAAEKDILIIDRIQDPGNMGTLIRTSEAMGFGGIILIKGCVDPFAPKVVRSSAGGVQRVPMLFADNFGDVLRLLGQRGLPVYAACMEGDVALHEADLKKQSAIIIGNEGNGIDKAFASACKRIYIPMDGKTESLNAAIAASIIMYECKRQKIQ